MAREKQKKIAKLLIDNLKLDKPLNAGEIVANSGYGVSMKKNPQVILNSKGVQEELKELGFNEYSAKKVVEEIMLSKKTEPNARLKATDQVFKVVGSYAPEKRDLTTKGNELASKEEIEKLNERFNEFLKSEKHS